MILVIDNYDSFTYNLVQYVGELGGEPVVRRNDETTVDEIRALGPDAIVISPGPGVPAAAGVSVDVVRTLGPDTPILGVCLGHQAIAEACGGRVVRAAQLFHGKTSRVVHCGTGLFEGIPAPTEVMRYHSLTVDRASLPPELEVTAWAEHDEAEIHGVRHREHPVWGVQFHPESVMTRDGRKMLANFLAMVR
jgi:anthranilate synthase/aminodeoxychorismate synthase-like glutamine amidotransferase